MDSPALEGLSPQKWNKLFVCSNHFLPSDYSSGSNRRTLNPTAVPKNLVTSERMEEDIPTHQETALGLEQRDVNCVDGREDVGVINGRENAGPADCREDPGAVDERGDAGAAGGRGEAGVADGREGVDAMDTEASEMRNVDRNILSETAPIDIGEPPIFHKEGGKVSDHRGLSLRGENLIKELKRKNAVLEKKNKRLSQGLRRYKERLKRANSVMNSDRVKKWPKCGEKLQLIGNMQFRNIGRHPKVSSVSVS